MYMSLPPPPPPPPPAAPSIGGKPVAAMAAGGEARPARKESGVEAGATPRPPPTPPWPSATPPPVPSASMSFLREPIKIDISLKSASVSSLSSAT